MNGFINFGEPGERRDYTLPELVDRAKTTLKSLGYEALRVGTLQSFVPDKPFVGSEHFQREPEPNPEHSNLPDTMD